MPSDNTVAQDTPYGWDWSDTTHSPRGTAHNATELAYDLVDALDPATVLLGKGLQGWEQSFQAYDADGYKIGAVYFGGRDDVHVKASSAAAHSTRPKVTGIGDAKTARVDTRIDFGPEVASYDDLAAVMRESADMYGSLVTCWQSDVRGQSRGRTMMVGAPTSAIRVRLYEKWLESPGQYPDGTNRIEVQLRPGSKSKRDVSTWSAAQTFCASRATRDLAERLGDKAAPVASLHTSRGTPDLERTIAAMGRQYRRGVREWMTRNDGDVTRIFDELGL